MYNASACLQPGKIQPGRQGFSGAHFCSFTTSVVTAFLVVEEEQEEQEEEALDTPLTPRPSPQ
eukprot:10945099-Prorocentrum_lima.AAC.1